MRRGLVPRVPTEKDIVTLDLSRSQSLREQRAPEGDQDVEGQDSGAGRPGAPAQLSGLREASALRACISPSVNTGRPALLIMRINKIQIRKMPTRFCPSLAQGLA